MVSKNCLEVYVLQCILGKQPGQELCLEIERMTIDDIPYAELTNLYHMIKGGNVRSKDLQVEIAFMAEIECHRTVLKFAESEKTKRSNEQ